MRNYPFRLVVFLFLGSLLLVQSCKKPEEITDNETQSAIDYSLAQREFVSMAVIADIEARNEPLVYKTQSIFCPNAQVTFTVLSPVVVQMIIDYNGSDPCGDTKRRGGRLKLTFTGKWHNPGSKIKIEPDTTYEINGIPLAFRAVNMSSNGLVSPGVWSWSVGVDSAVFDLGSKSIFFEAQNVITWDDSGTEYKITGTATGIDREDIPFMTEITTSLVFSQDCKFFKGGATWHSPENHISRVITYGIGEQTGPCDEVATLISGEIDQEFNLTDN